MIKLQNLCYHYRKKEELFKDLNLDLSPGKIVGLLGKNGSGKTTLLKIICGLLFPKSGQVQVLDHQPKLRRPVFLGQLFFIPEEFHLPAVTIDQYIEANSGFYPTFDQSLMRQLLKECELPSGTFLNQISFGQKKKFLITFALATKCKLLLLDEPTNGLDIPSKSIFRSMVAGSLDNDQLVIISTHQVKDIENLIDSMIILDQGNIILNKDLSEVSSQLRFSKRKSLDGLAVIYSEAIPGGFNVISALPEEPSVIDMELLFNAVTSGTQILKP
ncbi:MAG: ABC transporter ATP-binding protein [Cyclobacteriaceae bacterium]|nr:MAG: ABC transporter ATP-binding protein [Cyclobacteriaceae bacterium]